MTEPSSGAFNGTVLGARPDAEPALLKEIKRVIRANGPLTFAQFMALALYHSEYGYYRSDRVIWGEGGDYVTNADFSTVFSKLLAREIEELWRALGAPDPVTLVEAGGGRGSLLRGVLSASREFYPSLYDAVKPYMVELSQTHKVEVFEGKTIGWLDSIEGLGPMENAIVFSNELLDAMPFHRVENSGGVLKEKFVTISEAGGLEEVYGEPSTCELEDYLKQAGVELSQGQGAEISLQSAKWIEDVGNAMERGAVITIDYGLPARELYSAERDGTLMCHYRHTINENPFDNIGSQDITAHVDFSTIVAAGQRAGLGLTGFTTQLNFLLGLGIAGELIETSGDGPGSVEAVSHNQIIKELIMPGAMGDTFKVLIQHKGIDRPELLGFSFKDRAEVLQNETAKANNMGGC